jgi:DNA mismatch endonuclease (patch repair protein)
LPDFLTPAQRSERMARIRSTNTRPEKAVRSLLHRLGCRFRLHGKNLPGRPDVVLPKYRKAVFVHGCFWHRHACRPLRLPETDAAFWAAKFAANVARDRRKLRAVRRAGWGALVVWGCQIKDRDRLERRLRRFLAGTLG